MENSESAATISRPELRWFYGVILAFIASSLFFLAKEQYWMAAMPLLVAIVYLAVFSIDTLLYIIAFCTPFAIVLNDKSAGPALSFPTEPLMFGVLILFAFKFIFEGGFDRRILRHPVSVAIGIYFAWMFITTLTSSMPLVSLKHMLSQLWFIVPFYFLGTQLFRNQDNIRKFIWVYAIPLIGVILYTIVRHQQHGWTQKSAHWVMFPFYNDHTAYAAVIALFIPVILALIFEKRNTGWIRICSFLCFGFLALAMILSYTRAAWLSLVIAFAFFIIYRFRVGIKNIVIISGALLALFFTFRTDIMMKLEKNRQDSATDFNKHLQSISNISTDASNLERINRWNSAMRMFREKPFFGWGPGTYQFNYAPFQKSSEMTIISTNAGTGGNAHSEFIGPLAESGVPGMLAMILIVAMVLYRGSVLINRTKSRSVRILAMGILLGLITYFIHGTLNNFLDTDKLAVPFWSFIAMLVALDVYHLKEQEKLSGNGVYKNVH